MNIEEQLTVEAYKEELSLKTEQVVSLRVQLTVLDNKYTAALAEIEELKNSAVLGQEAANPDPAPEDSVDSD